MNRTNKTTVPIPSGPIIAGNCISCMGMVRISHSMSVNATVRCPHCQESFVLMDLLDQSLPPLEVVVNETVGDASEQEDAPYIDTLHLKRDEQENRPEKPRVKFEIPKALRDGARKKRRRRRRSRSSSSGSERGSSRSENSTSNFVIPSESPTEGASPSNDSTTMGEAVERRRSSSHRSSDGSRSGRRSSRSNDSSSTRNGSHAPHRGKVKTHASRLKEAQPEFDLRVIGRVLVGGILAFAMAYLMLIWIFKADPLGIAPGVSKTVPFAIPSSMQNVAEPEGDAVAEESKRELPSYLSDDDDVTPFEPETFSDDDDRIAVPNIDPDEVFGQEFGL